MSERLEDKTVEFRQYLALGHVNMDILNQASEIHELVIEQVERYHECRLGAMDLYKQNKRYREAIERAIKEGVTIKDCDEAINHIYGILGEALEGESDE